ncbi:unnamed protein product, partial [Musa banksii]
KPRLSPSKSKKSPRLFGRNLPSYPRIYGGQLRKNLRSGVTVITGKSTESGGDYRGDSATNIS